MSLLGRNFDHGVDKDLLDSFGVPIGDTERVLSVAFHPTKQYLAFGCENSCVKLWNLRTKLYVSIVPHPGSVHTLAFSQDGSLLCSASSGHTEGNTINLWECVYDVKNEEDITLKLLLSDSMLAMKRLEVLHQDTITSCCFMPPRNMKDMPNLVASGSKDTTVRIWCFPAKHRMTRQVLRHHKCPVNCVAFSDDGRYLVSGDMSGQITLLRVHFTSTGEDADPDQQEETRRSDKHGSDLKKTDDIDDFNEENMPLAPTLTFTHIYTYNMHEPILSLAFGAAHTLTTQIGGSPNTGPDRQYTLCVGTSVSVSLLAVNDGHITPFPRSYRQFFDEVTAKTSARNVYTDDTSLRFLPRPVNMSQVSLLWRQNVIEAVRTVSLSTYTAASTSAATTAGGEGAGEGKREYVSGYLKVKTNRMMFGKRVWDKWWFVADISHGQLCWYKSKGARVPVGFVRLEAIKKIKLMNQKKYPGRITLRLRGNTTKMELLCDDTRDAARWVEGITAAMDSASPETHIVCVGSGTRVLVYTVQILYEPVKNPSAELAYAMNLAPQVAHSSMSVIGECTDRVNCVVLPSTHMRYKMLTSQLLKPSEFLVGVASADQSVRLYRWSIDVNDEEEEEEGLEHEKTDDILEWETYEKLLARDIALEDRILGNPVGYTVPMRPVTESTTQAWVNLERPLTQHQLTLRVEQELKLRESKVEEHQIAPETTILGQPHIHNVSMLKLYRDNESDDDSEAPFTAEDVGIVAEEDEYDVMNDLSRRLLGAAAPEKASKAIVMAQANVKETYESQASKILRNTMESEDYFLSDDDDDSEEDDGNVHKPGKTRTHATTAESAVIFGKDFDEGKLATFARMAENTEKQGYGSDRTCNADCNIM